MSDMLPFEPALDDAQHALLQAPVRTRSSADSSRIALRPSERRARLWTLLHITETWNGGVGVYLEALLRQQLDDPRVGRIHLACSAARTPSVLALESHPKLTVHRYASSRSPLKVWSAREALQRVAESVRPDLVHLHSTFAGVYGRLLDLSCPVLYCAHGWSFLQEGSRLRRLLYAAVEAGLARRTDAIVHISHDELRAAHRRGVRAKLSRVVLHGVRPPQKEEAVPFAPDPARINLGFVGRFDRQKGTEILLEAFRSTKRTDLHLYLMGDFDRDAGSPALRRAAAHPRVTQLGWVPQRALDGYLERLDAIVVPSRWEGFGLVVAEAMRNGLPAIVSDRGGLPEQVIHGYNGLVFSMDDRAALAGVLERLDKATLTELGENARRVWAESFSEQRAYRELMELYEQLLGAHVAESGLSAARLDDRDQPAP